MSAPLNQPAKQPRCLLVFRVNEGRTSQLQPGNYPCTQPRGHDKGKDATPHTSVIAWKDVSDAKRPEVA